MSGRENSIDYIPGESVEFYSGGNKDGKKAILIYNKGQDRQAGSEPIKSETEFEPENGVTIDIPNSLRKAGLVGLAALSTVVPAVAAAEGVGVGEVNAVLEKIDFNTFGGNSASDYAFIFKEAGATNDGAVNLASQVLYTWDHNNSGKLDDKYSFTNYGEYLDVVRYAIEGTSDNVFTGKDGTPLSWLFRFDDRLKSNLYRASDWMEENGVGDAPLNLSKLGIGVFFAAVTQPDKNFDATWINKNGEICFNIGPENIGDLSDDEIRDTFAKAILSGVVANYDKGNVTHLPMDNDLNTILENYKSLVGEKMEGVAGVTVDFSSKYLSLDYIDPVISEIMNYQTPEPTPVPTEKVRNVLEAWREKEIDSYKIELKNRGAEVESRIDFGSRVLFGQDNFPGINGHTFKSEDFTKRVIEYVLTGVSDYVIYNENGDARIWLETKNVEIKNACIKSFDWLKNNKASDALDSMYNNGVCIIYPELSEPEKGPGSVIFFECGVVSPNMNSENIKQYKTKDKLKEDLVRMWFVESYGVAYYQIMLSLNIPGFDMGGNSEIIKSLIAAYVSKDLGYKDLYKHFSDAAKFYSKNYGISLDDPWIKRQLQLVADLIDPIGFKSLRDVKSFNKAISA